MNVENEDVKRLRPMKHRGILRNVSRLQAFRSAYRMNPRRSRKLRYVRLSDDEHPFCLPRPVFQQRRLVSHPVRLNQHVNRAVLARPVQHYASSIPKHGRRLIHLKFHQRGSHLMYVHLGGACLTIKHGYIRRVHSAGENPGANS